MSGADIKAIETEYNGYRFRSRLEARWAVFFDAARIAYEYEPEGFELIDGTKYLPDFYLPGFELYVEIKPTGVRDKIKEWEDKCRNFRSSTGKAILIKYGDPATDAWGTLFAWEHDDNGGGEYENYANFVPVGEWCRPGIIVMTFGERETRICVSPDMRENRKVVDQAMFAEFYWDDAAGAISSIMTEMFQENSMEGSFDYMREMARKARFEHGEKPGRIWRKA